MSKKSSKNALLLKVILSVAEWQLVLLLPLLNSPMDSQLLFLVVYCCPRCMYAPVVFDALHCLPGMLHRLLTNIHVVMKILIEQ